MFAVTENTDPEWVESQPRRYREQEVKQQKKRKFVGEMDGTDEREGAAAAVRRVKRSSEVEGEDEQPTKKRTRRSLPEKSVGGSKRKRASETRQSLPTKRTRTSNNGHHRTRQNNEEEDDEDEEDEINTSHSYNYTAVGGQQEQSNMELERRRAIAKGYAVTPLPSDEFGVSPSLKKKVAVDLVNLARVNSRVERMDAEYRRLAKELDEARRKEKEKNGCIEDEDGGPVDSPQAEAGVQQQPTPNSHDSNLGADIENGYGNDAHEPRDPASRSSSVEILLSQPTYPHPPTDNPSHFAFTPSRHPHNPTTSTPSSTSTNPPKSFARPFLPPRDAEGNSVRWSIPAQLTTEGRAEKAMIDSRRMEGESKTAKRRRMRREHKLVMQWRTEGEEDGREDEMGG